MRKQLEFFPKCIYCIDTSSLIDLHRYYRKDVFPTIWSRLEDMIGKGNLISPRDVYEEVKVGGDELYEWCNKNKKMFRDVDPCQMQEIKNIKKQYDENDWNNAMNKEIWADPWVIALSICEEAKIVAEEKNKPNRIPYIASKRGIECLKLLDFFKEIGIKY